VIWILALSAQTGTKVAAHRATERIKYRICLLLIPRDK
jgi:hypothetical protein